MENDNECSENAMAVFSSSKEMVGHIKEPLAIFFSLRRYWKILEIKDEISGKRGCSWKYLGIGRWHLNACHISCL